MGVSEKQKAYHMQKLRTHFMLIDKANNGFISDDDFAQMAERLKKCAGMLNHDSKARTVDDAFQAVSNVLELKPGCKYSLEDLVKKASNMLLSISCDEAKKITDNVHNAVFDVADAKEDGYISLQQYKVYFHILGHDISEQEIMESFNAIDANGDEKISRDEFLEAAFDFFINVDESDIANAFLGNLVQ